MAMMDRLVDSLGLNREKLRPAFDMAREMDDLDQFLADQDAPPGVERGGSRNLDQPSKTSAWPVGGNPPSDAQKAQQNGKGAGGNQPPPFRLPLPCRWFSDKATRSWKRPDIP